jgi:hypothetical protein
MSPRRINLPTGPTSHPPNSDIFVEWHADNEFMLGMKADQIGCPAISNGPELDYSWFMLMGHRYCALFVWVEKLNAKLESPSPGPIQPIAPQAFENESGRLIDRSPRVI